MLEKRTGVVIVLNNYRKENGKVYIEIFCKDKRMETVIDEEDFPIVDAHKGRWYAWYSKDNDSYYACGWDNSGEGGKVRVFYMHRVLMNPPRGMLVDHINHDTLDNTRANLRLVTPSENQLNRREGVQLGRSKERYVVWDSFTQKWRVRIRGKDHGRYKTLEEAVEVRDRVLKEMGLK